MPSFLRLPGLSVRDQKIGSTYFHTKIAKTTLNVDQGHCRWHKLFSMPHISFISGLL